jgi:hypothetical protein
LNKVAKGIGLALFMFWGASTVYELASRAPGESISIFGQLFFSVGLPYFVFFLIILWFMKTTGLNRLLSYLDRLDSYLASNNTKKRAKKKRAASS